nr:hypothetical protein [Tanacetum cinerariifolium]
MVKEGIVLDHKISKNEIEVDKAKVDVIAKLPHPTTIKGPFTITQVFPYGTIELSQPDGPNFNVNGHRVKHYFGGDIPSKKLQLNELNELRDQAFENALIYKEKTKKLHDSKIKNQIFNVGDRVLLFNSRLKIFSGKLKTRWSGPFTITKVFHMKPLSYLSRMVQTLRYVVPAGRKDEYETWAMKMEYWIMNTDHNLWKIIQNGNSKKSLGRDSKGGIIILPPVSFEEHVAVQRETKARTLLLQSLPEDHMDDFHHLDDAREIWLAVKARFGGNEESKKMKKTMLKQAFLEFSAKPDNDDVNVKFLRALPPSWSQVALTLKTRGGLEYLSFDDLYNKLRSLEIDVKGGSSYGSRNTTVAPTHFAFIDAASTNTKMVYSDQPSYSSSISYIPVPSGSIMKDFLHSFVMAMLSLRINKFQKKAGRKINFNNKDSARFDRRKARCYNCLQLGHFVRECNVKKVDEKARYIAFKISEVKTEEPKAMVSVDFMLNWNEHDAKNKTKEAEQAKIEKQEWEVKFVESLARFDKWQESSKNLVKLLYSSMSTRTKLGLGCKEYIRSDEVCNLSTPSVFDPEPENREVKSLYERFIKAGNMHEVLPTIIGTFMPNSYQSDLEETQDCNVHDTVDNFPFVVSKATSVPAGSRNSSASISAGRSIPAASRNRSASIHAGRSIPVASRNKLASIHAGKHIPAGRINKLAPFPVGSSVPTGWTNPAARPFFGPTNLCFDNVVLGEITDLICNEVPRTMVDLINLHGFALNDPQGRLKSMTGNKEKLDDFVQVKGGIVTFRGGDDIQPEQHINCLLAKTSLKEYTIWHRRMAHVNFKTINKLAKHGLVGGLPLKLFTNEHNCVACNKGKQHKVSYKAIYAVRTISEPLQLLRMDVFGPTSIRKNQLNKKIKAIRCDNGTEFQNANLITLCEEKGIKKDYSNARTPQQNGVAERKNQTLIEAARSMLADSKLPTMFWTEAGLGQEWYFDLDYLTDSLGYTRFKTNPPAGTHDTNILAGPTVHDISAPMENNLDYAEELARLQRQEYEAHSAAAKPGFKFSVDTAALLPQAEIEILRSLVPAAGDPTGSIVSTGGVPAGSVPAGGVPAGSVPAGGVLAGSIVSTGGVPAGSQVWKLVPLPAEKIAIDTKWILKNKRDVMGIMEIEKEVYVTQPKGFEDPHNPKHVYRVVKAIYKLHQAPRACQDKYVKDMLKKFDMESVRTATTPYEVPKHKSQDDPDDAVNVYLFRYMIVKKIFKYLKGQPNLGLWYPRDSPFQLEAYSDSDYAGSHGDRKSTTGGCQFLGRRLISWKCKKQIVVATSSTEAEYVAAASCCGQHHFIRDAYEKNLIQVVKIHIDENVADLLTKAFDGP